ncbi:hypothetical protein ACFL3G_02955 [Planctomycetota bacterium]
MDVSRTQSAKSRATAASDQERQKWVEEQAHRLQNLFESWQKPLDIDANEYHKYLKDQLNTYCDEPLLKSFIESI